MQNWARYIRISYDEQSTYSIDAQLKATEDYIRARGGQLVDTYIDDGRSARTDKRENFIRMRQDARKRKWDCLIVHKFDRFARNRTDSLAIKSLLRYDYNIKVFSVTEPSEDSDGPIGALIEGIMECVAEWYSRNLAEEVAKGRREKSTQGYHNCITPPFGYKKQGKLLVPEESEVEGVRLAFNYFVTGQYSYNDVARLLNEHGYKSKTGRVFTKDTVREILRNEIYIGRVRYQETRYNADGTRNFFAPVEWFDGQHEPLIDTELFERCQTARQGRAAHRQTRTRYNPYLLRGLVYCHRCCSNPPENADFPSWGKMFCQTRADTGRSYYRCAGRAAGFHCGQGGVNAQTIDEQVIAVLMQLRPPENWRTRIIGTMSEILGEKNLEQRLNEIRSTVERMDFRWDQGFITDKVDYLEKRLRLQQELEQLSPVQEELDIAADLLANFQSTWDACQGDIEKQHQLVKMIVERVYVEDDVVVAVTLKSDYHVVLGHKTNEPTYMEVDPYVHVWALRDLNP
jgi:site-specific DNA recombinase